MVPGEIFRLNGVFFQYPEEWEYRMAMIQRGPCFQNAMLYIGFHILLDFLCGLLLFLFVAAELRLVFSDYSFYPSIKDHCNIPSLHHG